MKLSDKAKKVIAAVAPGLGAALGGPLGGLAGNLITKALGGEDNIEEALLQQKPEVLLQLKAAERAYLLELKRLGIEEEKLHQADRADARALAQTDMRPHIALSALFIVGYFALLLALLSGEVKVPTDLKEMFFTLFGVITVNVPIIMQFWFGSSSGSVRKSDMLKERA